MSVHRRRVSGRNKAIGGVVAAAVVGTGAVLLSGTAQAAGIGAAYGTYAEQAATATQAQVKGVLGLSDSAAWKAVGVTPMIGVNDVASEIFKVDDAAQLVAFAKAKGLGLLSMWSATRDRQCSGGAKPSADASCGSVVQDPFAFSKAFAASG